MRKLLLVSLLSLSLYSYSQNDTQTVKPLTPAIDTVVTETPSYYNKPSQEDMDRNTRNILALMDENKQRQRKKAITNIAIGVGFLAILVVGLLRRKKRTNNQ